MNIDRATARQSRSRTAAKTHPTLCYSDLLGDGWREYPDYFKKYARSFFKRFDTASRCAGNDNKPGVQIQITVSEHDGRISMEMELCAGLKDKTWLKIQNYALPETVAEVTALIPRMLAVWESANDPDQRTGESPKTL